MERTALICNWWATAWFTVPMRSLLALTIVGEGWTTTWITVPPKLMVRLEPFFKWWTTAWFTVHPKLTPHSAHLIRRWTTTWITVPPKPPSTPTSSASRWNTAWFMVFLKPSSRSSDPIWGELLLGLRPSETDVPSVRGRRTMSYYLVTVLPKPGLGELLGLRAWTTAWFAVLPKHRDHAATSPRGELLPGLPYLRNADEDESLPHWGELLLGLPYLRNYSRIKGKDVIGELLLSLWYLRNWASRLPRRMVNYYLDYRTSETKQ